MPHQKTHDFLSGRWARDSQDSAEVLQMQFFLYLFQDIGLMANECCNVYNTVLNMSRALTLGQDSCLDQQCLLLLA